jgi:protein-disulfide reductase (glutathione)
MRIFSAVLAFVLLISAYAHARQADGADVWNSAEINWLDVPAGIKEATTSKKPVLMVMHAQWCTACKRYREVFKSKDIVSEARNFVMILVDIDKYPEINTGFAPDGTYVPRTLFMDAEGNINSKYIGKDPKYPHSINEKDPEELLRLMRQAAADAGVTAPTLPKPDPVSLAR